MDPKPRRAAPSSAFKPGQRANPAGLTKAGELPRSVFKPGQSGNPGGLTKELAAAVRAIRQAAAERGQKAVETLTALLDDENSNVRLGAACALLDRAGAKPMALEGDRLEVTTHDDGNAREALAALLLRRLAGGGSAGAPGPADTAPGGGPAARLAPVGET